MRKTFLMCGLMAIAAMGFIACDDEDDNNSNNNKTTNLTAEFVSGTDCLGSPYATETRTNVDENMMMLPSLVYKYDKSKGEVEINVENAVLTCGSTPKMDIIFRKDTLIIGVYDGSDGSEWARCDCLYNVKSVVKGVESKVYYIRPINSDNEEDVKVLELSQKEEGSFVFSNKDGILSLDHYLEK